jgi:hypothetical protein
MSVRNFLLAFHSSIVAIPAYKSEQTFSGGAANEAGFSHSAHLSDYGSVARQPAGIGKRIHEQGRMIGMKIGDEPISFDAVIERIAPEVPCFVVYPHKAWDETGTFRVDVSLNGIPIGLRNLIPWKERGWNFGLPQPICRRVCLETGDWIDIEMRRLGDIRRLGVAGPVEERLRRAGRLLGH